MRRNDPAIQDLEMTMSKYKRTVYGIAVAQLNNRHEADDVFQEVFLLYFCKRPVFQTEEQKRAWLIRVTVNKCRQYNFGKWNLHVDRTAEPEISAEFESQADKELYAAVKELPHRCGCRRSDNRSYQREWSYHLIKNAHSLYGGTGFALHEKIRKKNDK